MFNFFLFAGKLRSTEDSQMEELNKIKKRRNEIDEEKKSIEAPKADALQRVPVARIQSD